MLILQSVCNDYVLAKILSIVKIGLNILQIVVPIVLIVSGIIQFIKIVLNPDDDKKGLKKFINSIIAAVIVFLLPFIVNLTMKVININGDVGVNERGKLRAFDLSSCWEAANERVNEMDSTNDKTNKTIKEEEVVDNTPTNRPTNLPRNISGNTSSGGSGF